MAGVKKIDLKKRVRELHESFPRAWRAKPWFLALSGGKDSNVLAHVLLSLQPRLPPIHWLHVNYHLRRPHSDREERYLKKWAREAGVPLWTHSLHPKGKPANLQDWARRERYRFFQDIMAHQAPQGAVLLTAHHQGDQVETILTRMITGSSWQGYGGILSQEEREGYLLFRPFLEVPPEAISQYANSHSLKYFEDQSNLSHVYLRNRIRHELLPWLQRENPQISERILNWGQTARQLHQKLDQQAKRWLARHQSGSGRPKLPVPAILKLDSPARRHTLARWLQGHWGYLRHMGRHLDALEAALKRLPKASSLWGANHTSLEVNHLTIEIKKKKK